MAPSRKPHRPLVTEGRLPHMTQYCTSEVFYPQRFLLKSNYPLLSSRCAPSPSQSKLGTYSNISLVFSFEVRYG